MDQDSFRQLLQTPHAGSSNRSQATSRGSFLASTSTVKPKTIDASQPAFKPRKVKKTDSQYRDRAAERRVGEGNDFAQVEAILEDFKRRTADTEDKDTIEEQRQYLGGDKDHSILVKGLDIALLQQNKARAAQSTDDDDTLEQAFQKIIAESSVPKKRTREDIIKELKQKRQQGAGNEDVAKDEAVLLEEAKKAGKFRPIGFKPIGAPDHVKKKRIRKELEKDGESKKKKRKVESGSAEKAREDMPPPPSLPSKVMPPVQAEPEPEPAPEDFDIFVDAGDYEGIDLGDDDDEDEQRKDDHPAPTSYEGPPVSSHGGWFNPDPPGEAQALQQDALKDATITLKSHSPPTPNPDEEHEEPEQPTRLVPLSSSAIPSIRELLAMDTAQDKKKKRGKDKKKGGKEVDPEDKKKATAEAKADRDYKRLKTYTDKKASTSGRAADLPHS